MISLQDLQKDLMDIKELTKDQPNPEAIKEQFPFLRKSSCNKYPRFSRATQQYRENDTSSLCQICKKEYKHKYVLNSHMKVVHNIRPHRCKECGDSFDRIRDLKIHIEIAHLNCTKVKKYQKDPEFISEQLKKQQENQDKQEKKNSDETNINKSNLVRKLKELQQQEKSPEKITKKLIIIQQQKEDILNKSQQLDTSISNDISQNQTNDTLAQSGHSVVSNVSNNNVSTEYQQTQILQYQQQLLIQDLQQQQAQLQQIQQLQYQQQLINLLQKQQQQQQQFPPLINSVQPMVLAQPCLLPLQTSQIL